jgi:hypothetical protein
MFSIYSNRIHIWQTVWYLSLWDWFFSLNMMISSSSHFPQSDISFFFVTE